VGRAKESAVDGLHGRLTEKRARDFGRESQKQQGAARANTAQIGDIVAFKYALGIGLREYGLYDVAIDDGGHAECSVNSAIP
jgi:hypothetical protein